ncbi:MAG: sigma-70 family RNA polymerase sigma factor [Phycisphaerae bacterium]|nr:sigma-70 family RNA polymerase sigma factor [Phycisphaerae bacterium]
MVEQASKLTEAQKADVADAVRTTAFEESFLVRRCQNGQADAFAELVRRYQDRIYNLIYRMCRRPEIAEELAQETFLKAFANIGRFQGTSRFYTWLFRIAKNLTISHLRRGGVVKFVPFARGEDDDPSPGEAQTATLAERREPNPAEKAMANETLRRIEDALLELDEEHRVMVLLRDMEDMSYEEIGDILDIPPGTVKSRLHRARCALRERLANLVSEYD